MPFVDEPKVTEWTNRLKSYFALLTHKHDASDITSGTLTVSQGGTGATDAATARTNLAVPSTTDLANIESSIAYVESTTARTNHAAGDYFMLGNVLMRATAAIATGEQITTSKATPVTIQSQIDSLRDSVAQIEDKIGNLAQIVIIDDVQPFRIVVANSNSRYALYYSTPVGQFKLRDEITQTDIKAW